jgi:hypothetical protein
VYFDDALPGGVGNAVEIAADRDHSFVGNATLQFDSSSTVLAAPAEGKWRISAVFGELGSKIGQKCSATS